uniref:Uncharacterized protein n=1 Tax=Rangifer tarandus platyrhynchus TaxID=3082113 RepID=A0ACB0F6J4_RANTA|nr:unnamed protein product [Rangifer tarandus platyrhynchus]
MQSGTLTARCICHPQDNPGRFGAWNSRWRKPTNRTPRSVREEPRESRERRARRAARARRAKELCRASRGYGLIQPKIANAEPPLTANGSWCHEAEIRSAKAGPFYVRTTSPTTAGAIRRSRPHLIRKNKYRRSCARPPSAPRTAPSCAACDGEREADLPHPEPLADPLPRSNDVIADSPKEEKEGGEGEKKEEEKE